MTITIAIKAETVMGKSGHLVATASTLDSNVRRYRPQDKYHIRQIYLDAQKTIISSAFIAGLQKPNAIVPALLTANMVVMVTSSLWLSMVVLAFIAAAIYVSYYLKFMMHITHSLDTDLANIQDYYSAAADGSSFWVVEREGSVAGFVGVVHKNKGTVELQRLTVRPEYQRQGIAEGLCRHVIQMYAKMEYHRLILECTESHNAAKHLYRKLGFNVTDCVTVPYALSTVTLEHHALHLE